MEDLTPVVQAANGLTWPGAFALAVCAIAVAYVLGQFIRSMHR